MAVTSLSDIEFKDALASNNKVIIKFYADWCGSCRLISPKFKKLSENPEYEGISFVEVNAEQSPEARSWAKVNNLPFFAIARDGELVQADNFSKEEKIIEMLQVLGNEN